MHLVYTLIASGLLVLAEVPAGQPPPLIPHHAIVYAEGRQATQYRLEDSHFASDFSPAQSMDSVGELYFVSSPDSYPDIANYLFPTEYKQVIEARQSSQASGKRLQSDLELTPSVLKSTLTAVPTLVATPAPAMQPAGKYDNWMTTYGQSSVLPITGLAMFYNPNVMQEVVKNRLAMGQISECAECIGSVALLRAGDLNRRVWLQWADGVVEGPFLVTDVAAMQHIPLLIARNWAVDVDNFTAVRRGMNGPVMVTVWDAPPAPSQSAMPPFAPLYPSMLTPSPTATPLPMLKDQPSDSSRVLQAGFPTETPIPTITPLPALSATPVAVVAATQTTLPTATFVPSPTQLPTQSEATSTPIPAQNLTVVATSVVTQGGFPPDTPIPTMTPLPAINATPMAAVAATQAVMPTQTPLPTLSPTLTPTVVMTPTPASTELPYPVQQGFPPDTPVPTMTPLPAINPLPSPTPTIFVN